MDARKKRQLIILGLVVAVFAVGFVIWSKSSVPEIAPIVTTPPSAPAQVVRSGTELVYPMPVVFPINTSFDGTVMSQLKTFQNFQPTKLAEDDLGRQNPFNNY